MCTCAIAFLQSYIYLPKNTVFLDLQGMNTYISSNLTAILQRRYRYSLENTYRNIYPKIMRTSWFFFFIFFFTSLWNCTRSLKRPREKQQNRPRFTVTSTWCYLSCSNKRKTLWHGNHRIIKIGRDFQDHLIQLSTYHNISH